VAAPDFGRGARWLWRKGGWEITISPRCLTECFPCCSCVRFWVAGTEVWGRIPGWLGFEKRGGGGPGGICVCLLACLPEIQWLRRRARRDSAMVERILTLINIYIFICAPFFAYFAAKFGPFRSLLIKSPLQCNTSIYICMYGFCPAVQNSDCSLFNCQTI